MHKLFSLLIIAVLTGCNTETTGEYRRRVIDVVCECVAKEASFNNNKVFPNGNVINTMSKNTKDSLLKIEKMTLSNLGDCIERKKLSKADITFFWNDYDIGKMPLCDSAFENYRRYVFQLIHGSF